MGWERRFNPLWQRGRGSRRSFKSIRLYVSGSTGSPKAGLSHSFLGALSPIEFQTIPGCLAALNGTRLNINPMNLGSHGTTPTGSPDQAAFNHYHYYVFPLVHMLELFSGKGCNPGGYSDFDLLYISELDPTWSNGEISYFANPEAALFANPAALASCIPDALSSTVNKPLEPLFWCAGTWGLVYPLTGRINERLGILRRTSLGAVRVMTQIHRRGFAWLRWATMLCATDISRRIFRRHNINSQWHIR